MKKIEGQKTTKKSKETKHLSGHENKVKRGRLVGQGYEIYKFASDKAPHSQENSFFKVQK